MTNYQVSSIATDYAQYDAVAIPGLLVGHGMPVILPYANIAKSQVAKWTIAVPATVDANATYEAKVNGETVQAKTGSSTNQAQLAALLLAALRSNPVLMRGLKISESSNTLTIERLIRGMSLTVSSPSNGTTTHDLTVTEVTSVEQNLVVPFGRFVGRQFDFTEGAAGLITSNSATHATGQPGFQLLGVTVASHASERSNRGLDPGDGYGPERVMNVFSNRGNSEGIWVECTPENDIGVADSFTDGVLFVATTSGFQGMLTKDVTTYTGRSLVTSVQIHKSSVKVLGDRVIAQISFDRLAA